MKSLKNSLIHFCKDTEKRLEESTRGSEFVINSVNSMYCKLWKINLNRKGSYIDSPEWLKNRKTTINPKTNDDKGFQYALNVVLNYQSIKKDLQRIAKNKPFTDKYIWKKNKFPIP